MHNNGCQSVLRDRHYDGIWFWRVGKWLHCMEKTYQEWLHEVDLSYHILGLRHALIQKGLQRREEAPHNTATTRQGPNMSRGDPRSLCRYTQGRNRSCSFFVILDPCPCQKIPRLTRTAAELLQNYCSFVQKKCSDVITKVNVICSR